MNLLALALASALHLAMLALALYQPPKPKPPPVVMELARGMDIEFLPTGHDAQSQLEGDNGAVYERECEGQKYVGIGIVHSLFGLISAVHPNGPARAAGVRVGDVMLSLEEDGEGFRVIRLARGDETIQLRLPVQDICYKPVEHEVRVVPHQ